MSEQGSDRWSRGDRAVRGAAAVAVIAVAGCGLDPEVAAQTRHDWIFQRAQEVRELPLLEPVSFRRITQAEYLAEREDHVFGLEPERFERYAETYGRLGFFDRDLDQRLVSLVAARSVAGYYQSGAITLIGDEIDDEVYLHEAVHALQDQHFGLNDFLRVDTSSAFVARRAVSEGGSELARERFRVQQGQAGADLDDVAWGVRIAEEQDQSYRFLDDRSYPVVFASTAGIAYSYGLIYCAHHLLGVSADEPTPAPAPHDWGRQDALWSSPPDRGEQVLALDAADATVPVGITEVPHDLSDRFELVDWDVLGRWHNYLLLFPLREEPGMDRPWDLAAAWDGDAVLFLRDLETEAVGLVYASRWDDEVVAGRVVEALVAIHGVDAEAGLMPGTASDGESIWLERRQDTVVLVRNVDPSAVESLVAAAFDPAVAAGEARAERVGPSFAAWLDSLR